MADTNILKIAQLKKVYGDVIAVAGIDFEIRSGEIVGLLGPNGAGKTTTINMILGVLEPTSGLIELLGQDINSNRAKSNKQLNFSAVYAHLPGNLTVWQNLYFFGLLYEVPNLLKQIDEAIDKFDLEKFRNTKVGVLSSGEQSRVNLAKATLNRPCLLLLDEPTASLDPSVADEMRVFIKEYIAKTQAGILWTSHNMLEIEAVCDRVLFLSHGKVILEGNPKTLAQEYGKKDLEELFISVAREPLVISNLEF